MSQPLALVKSPSSSITVAPSPSATNTSALVPRTQEHYDVRALELWEQTYGIVNAEDCTVEERLLRIAALVPVALEIVDEARATIVRLRDEVAQLRADKLT